VDVTTLLGIAIGAGAILIGQLLEGGRVGSLAQLTAAVIVLGGTLGAVVTQFPGRELRHGLRCLRRTLWESRPQLERHAEQLVALARQARREGMLKLEEALEGLHDPFFESAVGALLEGHSSAQLRSLLDAQLGREHDEDELGPRLLEAAGGYAPTLGILGAVLGLIQVMENLSEPDRLGSGIAIAFVATVYGVGAANLVFLPLAQKLRVKLAREVQRKELILEGVCAIQEGMNPALLARRLRSLGGGEP
jgi:chemotaxis protein MotA